jgi:hypothetical protein
MKEHVRRHLNQYEKILKNLAGMHIKAHFVFDLGFEPIALRLEPL